LNNFFLILFFLSTTKKQKIYKSKEDGRRRWRKHGGSRVRYFMGDKDFDSDIKIMRYEIIGILSLEFLTSTQANNWNSLPRVSHPAHRLTIEILFLGFPT